MLLAFDDDLLATIDELISTVLREVFLSQELATSFEVFVGFFPMLLGDAFGETTL